MTLHKLFAAAVLVAALDARAAAAADVHKPGPAPTAPAAPQVYRIGLDDVIDVAFWRDKDLSASVAVRPDGCITLPLLNDVHAAGLTPAELAERLRVLASEYLAAPNVTVAVRQINSRKVFITGEVVKPGVYALNGPTTVLQLIAMAGGLTDYANRDRIGIIRAAENGSVALTFNYNKASQLKNLKDNLSLEPGDTIVVR